MTSLLEGAPDVDVWGVDYGAPDGCLIISNHKADVRKVFGKIAIGSDIVIKHDPRILSG